MDATAVTPIGALEYHRLTSYSPARFGDHDDPRMVQGYRPMQLARRPPPHKVYPGRAVQPVPAALGDVLFLAAGVVRVKNHPVIGRMLFRAAGSAGNLAPVEVYVVVEGRVYHYDPSAHALTPIGPAGDGPVTIVLTGVPWRTGWKYTERGFRHLYWDAGTMLSQLLAAAPESRLCMGFVDDDVARLVGADGTHEFPLAVVVLGDGEPPLAPPGQAQATGFLGPDLLEFPVVTAAQRAGELASPADVARWRRATATPPTAADLTFGHGLREVVRRRGSTRQFDPSVTGPAPVLVDALAAAASSLNADFVEPGSTLLDHHLLVHAIDGFAPGTYRGTSLLAALDDSRALGRFLTLNQDLGGDGCYTAFHSCDLATTVEALGDRGYRCALLEAGVVEGRLHLAAYALGFGATGLTFFDDEVRRAFDDTASTPMLVTAVGHPTYTSTPGGEPGRPSTLRSL